MPSTAPPSTAGRVLDLLASVGVETVFGLPGVHNLAFWRELGPGRPRILGVRHEQAAAYAADGLARATGGLGVALTTTGPGAANAVAAFGEASASGSPVLLLASDVPVTMRSAAGGVRGLLHESADQGALFAPLAKRVWQPLTPEEAVAAVAEAAACALSAPRGPVYVGIPADALSAAAPTAPVVEVSPPLEPGDEQLEYAARLVDRAVRPVIWVGGGAVAARAGSAVAGLAQRIAAPVVETYAARGLLAGSPWQLGAPPHEPDVAELIGRGDLLIAVGSDLDAMTTRAWAMPRPPRLLAVNCDSAAAVRGYGREQVDLVLVSDAARGAGALVPRVVPNAPWCDAAAVTQAVRTRLRAAPDSAEAMALVTAVEDAWPADGDVVVDMAVAGTGSAATPRCRAHAGCSTPSGGAPWATRYRRRSAPRPPAGGCSSCAATEASRWRAASWRPSCRSGCR
jgi:acetolactate synthase-1/2/3 large subunit